MLESIDDNFGWIVLISSLIIIVFIGIYIHHDIQLDLDYTNGKINVEEYCNQKTNGGTDTIIPVVCYQVYNVHVEGTKQECHMVGKIYQCHTIPILKAN